MEHTRPADFVEVADRVWVARHEWFDMNVIAVGGTRGLLVVDTLPSARAARAAIESLARAVAGDVVAIVNTHEHFDHVLGNRTFHEHWPGAPLIAHRTAAERTLGSVAQAKAEYLANPQEPGRDEVVGTEPLVAETTFVAAHVVDLGDRSVELVHPGRGHTAGDVVLVIPDADVVLAGDLIEESASREHTPGFGPESHPMDWPATLDLLAELIGPRTLVVPGHGGIVDREFVAQQRDRHGTFVQTVIDLAAAGASLEDLRAHTDWPFPRHLLTDAIGAAYRQLPPGFRRLPLA